MPYQPDCSVPAENCDSEGDVYAITVTVRVVEAVRPRLSGDRNGHGVVTGNSQHIGSKAIRGIGDTVQHGTVTGDRAALYPQRGNDDRQPALALYKPAKLRC